MTDSKPEEASIYVLNEAERMFLERGYAGTKLRDLAAKLAMKPASLYYHAPGGKEELWQRVMERALNRHRTELTRAAEQAGPQLRSQLLAMADWLVSQPPMNVLSIASAELYAFDKPQANQLSDQLYEGVMGPIAQVFRAAIERGEIRQTEPDLLAGTLIASINGLLPLARTEQLPRSAQELAHELVDILLSGLLPR